MEQGKDALRLAPREIAVGQFGVKNDSLLGYACHCAVQEHFHFFVLAKFEVSISERANDFAIARVEFVRPAQVAQSLGPAVLAPLD